MNYIEFKLLPYDEDDVLYLIVSASAVGFSGFVEVYTHHKTLAEFGNKLINFPEDINHKVDFEYGDTTGKWAYYLFLQAQVIDHVGHSAIRVRMQSFVGMPCNSLAEFYVPSEVASINELGRAIKEWVKNPYEPLLWQPKA